MGYQERLSYTAIGDVVNLASRLEGLNRHYGTRILISETTHELVHREFLTRPVDYVAVRGRKAGVKVYELLGLRQEAGSELLGWVSLCEEAHGMYLSRDWNRAKARFEAAVAARPQDGAARLLAERCAAYAQEPPPEDWTGFVTASDFVRAPRAAVPYKRG
jgi:adenylate cyclase